MKNLLMLLCIPLFVAFGQSQDHSEFFEDEFETPQEVTENCLTCHDTVGDEVLKTKHWNWGQASISGQRHGMIDYGKKNLINNFCIAIPSNYPRCTSCHISYGWKDANFDFSDPNNIDCLICHDRTGTYSKIPDGAGMPDKAVNLLKVAKSVGAPTRANCGKCHFDGGGGSGVKHGDMDESLIKPSPKLDVHMGKHNFQCQKCHTTTNHEIAGASHGSIANGKNHFSCISCHGEKVHKKGVLNKHIKSVACETCHIPAFARQEPTVTFWDWSQAGKDIKPEKVHGKDNYIKKKGALTWEKDVRPVYAWYNGKADYYTRGDKFDDKSAVPLNQLKGDIRDPKAKITPFKLMKGKQPYDPENKYLIIPNVYGKEGYWKTFDWKRASEIGMQSVGLKFSGKVDFIETEMYWPINHMVPPASEALKCMNCHGKRGFLLDWEKLGYDQDPLRTRGRFNKKS